MIPVAWPGWLHWRGWHLARHTRTKPTQSATRRQSFSSQHPVVSAKCEWGRRPIPAREFAPPEDKALGNHRMRLGLLPVVKRLSQSRSIGLARHVVGRRCRFLLFGTGLLHLLVPANIDRVQAPLGAPLAGTNRLAVAFNKHRIGV